MIWLFLGHSFSHLPIAERRLVHGTDAFHGNWELSGASSFSNSVMSFEKSSLVFCNNRLPSTNWSVSATIECDISNLQIFISKRFGKTNPLVGCAICINSTKETITVEYRENSKTKKTISLAKTPYITFEISLQANNLTILINNNTLFSGTKHTDISKYWLSIEGKSAKISNLVMSYFSGIGKPKVGAFERQYTSSIIKESKLPTNTAEAVQMIDKLSDAVKSLSTVTHLSSVIAKELLPFTDAWQRRSVAIMKTAKDVKAKLHRELDIMEEQINSFSDEFYNQSYKLTEKVGEELSNLYASVLEEEFLYNGKMREKKKTTFSMSWKEALLFICIIEAFIVIYYFLGKWIDEKMGREEILRPPAALQKRRRRKRPGQA